LRKTAQVPKCTLVFIIVSPLRPFCQIVLLAMIIKIPVNRAECFRQRIDYDDDTLELEIRPEELSDEERDWIAKHLKEAGNFVPNWPKFAICPPTKEEFLRAVKAFMSDTHPYGESKEDAGFESA
jgi:hypothetical protein